jgi:hypothetical protein
MLLLSIERIECILGIVWVSAVGAQNVVMMVLGQTPSANEKKIEFLCSSFGHKNHNYIVALFGSHCEINPSIVIIYMHFNLTLLMGFNRFLFILHSRCGLFVALSCFTNCHIISEYCC